jgi:hypothetical protein
MTAVQRACVYLRKFLFIIPDPAAGGDLAVAMMVVVHACAGDPRVRETLRSVRHGGKESSDQRRLFPSSFRPQG